MFLKSVRIFKFFYYAIFGSVTKTFIFKNGLFLLCFVISKLVLKNISNSFYKGIGGVF
ncbi:hypothetical protein HPHPP16_0953 [Helicobacter pylori Hp P-16]|nr:hypothetical protein HPHPP16_0953 [Helicobacter pylori Hp P-16]